MHTGKATTTNRAGTMYAALTNAAFTAARHSRAAIAALATAELRTRRDTPHARGHPGRSVERNWAGEIVQVIESGGEQCPFAEEDHPIGVVGNEFDVYGGHSAAGGSGFALHIVDLKLSSRSAS